ncbi:(2Fe-2S)-binding protein [Deinococcus peraridilitoris]|uniref:Ferric siderophore reductase C-terminal domain-containing protein n=1 Tax=Deinococcus peraridilitoris (strain DSM 19664 / LMG 22246 / CIP 109416 / KR-200) TaxID=937777 RepID=L0A5W0_DEIPD|nr:(2Fe-2S)-binding protein [Deinococcus peraridilitoris]AFZ69268.1 hypothetical protein Deipe_3848 [Deinococcus peraridilitoris DSM 19664]
MNTAKLLIELNARQLYLNVQPTVAGRTLDECVASWPSWRARLLALRPQHRPATADVLLLNALFWPVSMLHLATAFIHGFHVQGEVRLDWPHDEPRPFGQLNLITTTLVQSGDPLGHATGQIFRASQAVTPATQLRERLVVHVACDRAVQALLVLGQATGQPERAAEWATRLTEEWPVPHRTRVRQEEDGNVMVRSSCCYHYLDFERCGNCPADQTTAPPA